MKNRQNNKGSLHFPSVDWREVNTHTGRHHKIISEILSDLARLDEDTAIKIDLAEVGKKKADLRSAIHRAAKKKKLHLATTSDEKHLYVFWAPPKTAQRSATAAAGPILSRSAGRNPACQVIQNSAAGRSRT